MAPLPPLTVQHHLLYGLASILVQAWSLNNLDTQERDELLRTPTLEDWRSLTRTERSRSATWEHSATLFEEYDSFYHSWRILFRQPSPLKDFYVLADRGVVSSVSFTLAPKPDDPPDAMYIECYADEMLLPEDVFPEVFRAVQTEIRLFVRRHKLWISPEVKKLLATT